MKIKRFSDVKNYTLIAEGGVGGNYVSVRSSYYESYIGTEEVLKDGSQCLKLEREDGLVKFFLKEGEKLYGYSNNSIIYVVYHNTEENPQSESKSSPINLTGTIQLNQQ